MLAFSLVDITSEWYRITGLINIACIILLLYNGTLMGSKHWFYIQICGLVLIASFIMKVMHLKGADIILILPNPVIMIVYFDHFRKKTGKRPLDFVKLLWVLVSFTTIPLILLRILEPNASYVSQIIILIAVVLWLIDRTKQEPNEEVLDDDGPTV